MKISGTNENGLDLCITKFHEELYQKRVEFGPLKAEKNKMCAFCQANLNWGLQQRFCLGGLLTKTLQKNGLKILLNSKSRKYDKMRVFCDLF